jgi:hypothetical protein
MVEEAGRGRKVEDTNRKKGGSLPEDEVLGGIKKGLFCRALPPSSTLFHLFGILKLRK